MTQWFDVDEYAQYIRSNDVLVIIPDGVTEVTRLDKSKITAVKVKPFHYIEWSIKSNRWMEMCETGWLNYLSDAPEDTEEESAETVESETATKHWRPSLRFLLIVFAVFALLVGTALVRGAGTFLPAGLPQLLPPSSTPAEIGPSLSPTTDILANNPDFLAVQECGQGAKPIVLEDGKILGGLEALYPNEDGSAVFYVAEVNQVADGKPDKTVGWFMRSAKLEQELARMRAVDVHTLSSSKTCQGDCSEVWNAAFSIANKYRNEILLPKGLNENFLLNSPASRFESIKTWIDSAITAIGNHTKVPPCIYFSKFSEMQKISQADEDYLRSNGRADNGSDMPGTKRYSATSTPVVINPTVTNSQEATQAAGFAIIEIQPLSTQTPVRPNQQPLEAPDTIIQTGNVNLEELAYAVYGTQSGAYVTSCTNNEVTDWHNVTFSIPTDSKYVFYVDLSQYWPQYLKGGCGTISVIYDKNADGVPITTHDIRGFRLTGFDRTAVNNDPLPEAGANAAVPTQIDWVRITLADLVASNEWQADLYVDTNSDSCNDYYGVFTAENQVYMSNGQQRYNVDFSGYGGYVVAGRCMNIRVSRIAPTDPSVQYMPVGTAYAWWLSRTPATITPIPTPSAVTIDIKDYIKRLASYYNANPNVYTWPMVACQKLQGNIWRMVQSGDPCDEQHAFGLVVDWTSLYDQVNWNWIGGGPYFGPCNTDGFAYYKQFLLPKKVYLGEGWCLGPGN